MQVAVSGATGFLGGHLVDRLLAEGASVVALGRNAAGLARLEAKGARTAAVELTGAAALPPGLRAEVFVHAAALSSTWGRRDAFLAANVEGTCQALQLAREMGARRFAYISSPSLYFRFADQLAVGETVHS